jgi:Zn finger protein HypA/HybF involved in hydrogenase expression
MNHTCYDCEQSFELKEGPMICPFCGEGFYLDVEEVL